MGSFSQAFLLLWICLPASCSSLSNKNGYIFTCPRVLRSGTENKLNLRRFGNLHAGVLEVKVTRVNADVISEKRFNIPSDENDSDLQLYVKPTESYNDARIHISGVFLNYNIKGTEKVLLKPSRNYAVLIQTDKLLYKEGQTVKFRILVVDKDFKPAINNELDIWVEDPSGTKLFQWKAVSLEKGMKQFEFPLADEPVKGKWKISASFEGEIANTEFEVKKYVLPKYDVKIIAPPYVLRSDKEIPITVCAKYTYGKSVTGKLHLNISHGKDNFQDKKTPTLEYRGEINGCFNYNFNVSWNDNEDYDEIYHFDGSEDYDKLKISAMVEEYNTGIQRKETRNILRYLRPFKITFNNDQRNFYKPGLPYYGKLTVNYPDSTPATNEPVQICYSVRRKESFSYDNELCRNYTSDENGEINFIIPPQNANTIGISCLADSLKYREQGEALLDILSQTIIIWELSPWYSPSENFIQLQPVQEPLPCGATKEFKILYTFETDSKYELIYQVFSQGKVVLTKNTEATFSISDDISQRLSEENRFEPNFDELENPVFGEDVTFKTESQTVSRVGEFDFEIEISPRWSPAIHILVYYVRDDRETVADSQEFRIEKCFGNQVKFQFDNEIKQPGTKTSIRISASPSSLCGIKVVDKSISLISSNDQLTKDKIFNNMKSFDSGNAYTTFRNHKCILDRPPVSTDQIRLPYSKTVTSSSIYQDSFAAFQNAGLAVISDMTLLSRPCKEPENFMIPDKVYAYSRSPIENTGTPITYPASTNTKQRPKDSTMDREDVSTKSIIDVRNYFPETWLFEMEMTDENGEYTTKEKLPHTITEWVGSAACINEENGLGVSKQATIKGFQAFFLGLTLPYSAIRGEVITIPVSVFSYVEKSLPITITMHELGGFEVVGESIDGDICVHPGTSTNLKVQLKAISLNKQNITVRAKTTQSSSICGSSNVSDAVAKDAISDSVLIEAEGWPAEETESVLFCPKDQENGYFEKTFSLSLPEDVVPDSARGYIDVIGNVLGKSIDNLENLVQIPTGCGEQNMIKFTPNVVALDVLTNTNQLTDKLKSRIIKNLNKGSQRQLQYRHPDGSFSAFGRRDTEGSMFLTAFVLRYFSAAANFITIDNSTLVQMQNWIISKQQSNGCFPDVGKIINRELEGGLKKDKSEETITAYVLISLLLSGYQDQTVLDSALTCIKNIQDKSFYATFLYAYAEALAGKEDSAKERLNLAKYKAITEAGVEYYHDENATKSQDIETASYAVLAMLKLNRNPLAVVRYLTKNMNPRGGFHSTQDTCVGLQALGEFAKMIVKDEINITVKTSGGLEKEIKITEDNKFLVKRYKIEEVPSDMEVKATGSGCAIIQKILRYNTKTSPEKDNFRIGVIGHCVDDSCRSGTIAVTLSYIPEDKKTGMALVEIKMISGWIPKTESLQQLLNEKDLKLMRYDVENNVVVFYFSVISNMGKHFSFKCEKKVDIENSQPGSVKVYDYYTRDVSSSTVYSFEKCAEGTCTKEL